MAISDAYAVQYLLEGTQSGNAHILWREHVDDVGGYVTQVGNVEIQLSHFHSRTGEHVTLRFRSQMDELYLHEPSSVGWYISMQGFEVEDGMTVQPNCAYITLPNHATWLCSTALCNC